MLQIDHVYEFFYKTIFTDNFDVYSCGGGVVNPEELSFNNIHVFTPGVYSTEKIFFYDQEPVLPAITLNYLSMFNYPSTYKISEIYDMVINDSLPYGIKTPLTISEVYALEKTPEYVYKNSKTLVTSEHSKLINEYAEQYGFTQMYYFFHGFAALDWYRGFYALNYNKQVVKEYTHDYVTFNRLVHSDRSYRCYFISRLAEELLLEHGQVSFGLASNQPTWQDEILDPTTKLSKQAIDHIKLHLPSTPLVIDSKRILGSASADIPRCINDSLWHIVTETVFYYDKLHLTEKIFKPIVMKQPFMLLAGPSNLAYLRSYGFKTFEGIIDESYDTIQDPDARIDAVVRQLVWYCALSTEEKQRVIEAIAPIVEYNFHHFYGEFKHIITRELLDNCQTLFKEIGYNDNAIAYDDVYQVLTT